MAAGPTALRLDALGPEGAYRTRAREVVTDTGGDPVLEMSLAPRLFVTRTVAAQRRAAPLPASERAAALHRAAELFTSATLAGLDFTDYVQAADDLAGSFDLVVVDGRAREACLTRAADRLAPDGLVVVDNVDRARYRSAIAELADRLTDRRGSRVEVTWTRGLTPSLPYPTRTALLRVRPPVVAP